MELRAENLPGALKGPKEAVCKFLGHLDKFMPSN